MFSILLIHISSFGKGVYKIKSFEIGSAQYFVTFSPSLLYILTFYNGAWNQMMVSEATPSSVGHKVDWSSLLTRYSWPTLFVGPPLLCIHCSLWSLGKVVGFHILCSAVEIALWSFQRRYGMWIAARCSCR